MADETPKRKPVRVWADGCFDMMHYGHSNALRQAKSLGDFLVVGVHSDEEIRKHKGPTVMKEEERYAAVAACKWVDLVVKDAPYVTSLKVLDEHNIDFCVHGDDESISADGTDTYHEVKSAGRFRTVPRTLGVSSTDLVGRMLLLTKAHFSQLNPDGSPSLPHHDKLRDISEGNDPRSGPKTIVSQFIPTSRKIVQFAEGREPNPTDVVVYIDGSFDLFHVGHCLILEEAKKLGDYLVVGVYHDQYVNTLKHGNYPIMNLHERVLSVLSCRHVDEVIIGAPALITKETIETMRIRWVVRGTVSYSEEEEKNYQVPNELGLMKIIKSPSELTTSIVVERILKNRLQFEDRNKKKAAKETAIALRQVQELNRTE